MAKTHTVAQGETLYRIARQHKYMSIDPIYNHPDNAEFRNLRPNPNIIFPGDKIVIPEKEEQTAQGATGQTHSFVVQRPQPEMFRMKIQGRSGKAWVGKRIVLEMGDESIDAPISDNGVVEVPLSKGDESTGQLKVFMDPNSDEPTHTYDIQLGHLDPVEELSGVQARCNLLGFDCGVADGIMGQKTRSGVEAFQKYHGLDVDGEPGPKTQAKLKEVYGC